MHKKAKTYIYVIIFVFISFITFVTQELLYIIYSEKTYTENEILLIVFSYVMVTVVIALLFIFFKFYDQLTSFIDYPKDKKLTFPVVTNFLSEQALASFLLTVLVYLTKAIISLYGKITGSIFFLLLICIPLAIAVISIKRFETYVSIYKHGWIFYLIILIILMGVFYTFFKVGLHFGNSA